MRAADDADFSSFVAASSRRLLRGAYLITGDLAEAEDLLQTALERAYRRWPSIRQKDVPEAYVRKIVVTTAINAGRRRKFSSAPLDEQQLPGLADQAMENLPGRAALLSCVRELPAGQRAVLVLRYFDDLTEVETARVLGREIGRVVTMPVKGDVVALATTAGTVYVNALQRPGSSGPSPITSYPIPAACR